MEAHVQESKEQDFVHKFTQSVLLIFLRTHQLINKVLMQSIRVLESYLADDG